MNFYAVRHRNLQVQLSTEPTMQQLELLHKRPCNTSKASVPTHSLSLSLPPRNTKKTWSLVGETVTLPCLINAKLDTL